MDLQPKYTFQRPDRLKTVVENDMVLYETESGFGDKHKLRVQRSSTLSGCGAGGPLLMKLFFFLCFEMEGTYPPPPGSPPLAVT